MESKAGWYAQTYTSSFDTEVYQPEILCVERKKYTELGQKEMGFCQQFFSIF